MTVQVAELLHRETFDVWWEHLRPAFHITGPFGGPRHPRGTAWVSGRPSPDAYECEKRNDDGVFYVGGISDTGPGVYDGIVDELAGLGARWIWTGPWGICDHLLPECPAVRRRPRTARWGSGVLDPNGTDICGWCTRVWNARHPQPAGA